jgi:hypothetical protein
MFIFLIIILGGKNMKKWLSRGIVLAMIIAMMVPMPVAAASGKGTKQIKSYERYSYNANGVLQLREKVAYKYDSKGNVEETQISDGFSYFGPIAYGGTTTSVKFENKYKGKTLKSVTQKDAAGNVYRKETYKKGNMVKATETNFVDEKGTVGNYVVSVSYNKKDLPTALVGSFARSDAAYSWTSTETFAFSTKKGLVRAANIAEVFTSKSSDGTSYTSPVYRSYAYYNDKGLVTETGTYNTKGVAVPSQRYAYQMKKGRAVMATVLNYDPEKGTWSTGSIYKFSYNNTNESKADYAYDVNSKLTEWAF